MTYIEGLSQLYTCHLVQGFENGISILDRLKYNLEFVVSYSQQILEYRSKIIG